MKQRNLLMAIIVSLILSISSIAFASPGASILYQEADLGNGQWRYDYTFNNTSDNNEYLYSVWLDFDRTVTVTGLALPTGWYGSVWEGTNTTLYLETSSTGFSYDISAGNSKSGFSFLINYQEGDTPYTAYFDDHTGNISTASGTTALIVPEPISSVLFVTGGAMLGIRRQLRKRIKI
jgi:hypothetical protein